MLMLSFSFFIFGCCFLFLAAIVPKNARLPYILLAVGQFSQACIWSTLA